VDKKGQTEITSGRHQNDAQYRKGIKLRLSLRIGHRKNITDQNERAGNKPGGLIGGPVEHIKQSAGDEKEPDDKRDYIGNKNPENAQREIKCDFFILAQDGISDRFSRLVLTQDQVRLECRLEGFAFYFCDQVALLHTGAVRSAAG